MHSQPRPIRQDRNRTAYRERVSRDPTIVEVTITVVVMLLLARWLVVGPVGAAVSTAIGSGLVAGPIAVGSLLVALARGRGRAA